uniref:L1 transposable element RRM domain-containing protein n=1 Tax=Equus caballus TaxID=9796 RepID=A0A9L0SVY5_HORSE
MRNTINEIKNNLESIQNRADAMEERISDLEDRNKDMLQVEEERELRFLKNEEISEKYNLIRKSNIRIIGIPEGYERKKGGERTFKQIIVENFQNLGNEVELQVKEANRTPSYINARSSPRNIMVKLAKVNDKEKMLKTARQKKINYKGTSIRLSVDFSAATIQDRREWNYTFKILKDKNFQPRIHYPVKLDYYYSDTMKK